MSLHLTGMIWARPTSDVAASTGSAFQPGYIEALTRAHEDAGFDRVLAGHWTDPADGFLVVAHAASVAKRIDFLLAHRPGFVAPTVAARQLATLDNVIGGRLAVHVISGGDDPDQRRDGDYAHHGARYRRMDEFLGILRRIWTADVPIDHAGEFYRFENAWSDIRPLQEGGLPLVCGGASDLALQVAARHANVFALYGEPLAETRIMLERMRATVPDARKLGFSWSNRPILAATEAQAWEKAHDIQRRAVANLSSGGAGGERPASEAVTSKRLVALARRGGVLDERLWTAMAGVLGGRGNTTALVGTPEQVARAMLRYRPLGVSHYILRGWDPIPDTIQYGRELIPLLRELAAAEDRGRVSVAVRAAVA
jgi:alkanesulfonate monooxygenase